MPHPLPPASSERSARRAADPFALRFAGPPAVCAPWSSVAPRSVGFRFIPGLLFSLALLVAFAAPALAQRITSGPVPPPGTDMGVVPGRSAVLISGVPAYLWHHGCGPTAVGMIIGYYDTHGFPELVPGSAATQTPEVDAMIAGDSGHPDCAFPDGDHYQDYSCPIDESGPILADRSELGGAHASNCVGDFMRTSFSAIGNRYGWSTWADTPGSFVAWVELTGACGASARNVPFSGFPWNKFKEQIDAGTPVCLLVDTDGDNMTDHFVAAIGYDESGMLYACLNTWDSRVHWYDWSAMASGNPWGIYGVTAFHLSDTLRVAVDGSGDYPTIQSAIDAALDSDVVLLGDGVYTGTGNYNLDFRGKRITVRSATGHASACVIDCQELGRGVYLHVGETRKTVLRGVTIRNGGAVSNGGGIYLCHSSATIADCIVENNTHAQFGGGIFADESGSRLVNCVLRGNAGTSYGGGLFAFACLDSFELVNCTIAGNSTPHGGGGLWLDFAPIRVENCILWGNSPGQIAVDAGEDPTVRFTDVEGGWPGEGNLGLDPLFVDLPGGDAHLLSESPCIDAGSNDAVVPGIETDLEGNPRIADGDGNQIATVDMGAYEAPAPVSSIADARENGPTRSLLAGCSIAGSGTIRYSVPGPPGAFAHARLELFDCGGRAILTLLDRSQPCGEGSIRFSPEDTAVRGGLRSGVYFLRLTVGSTVAAAPVVVVR